MDYLKQGTIIHERIEKCINSGMTIKQAMEEVKNGICTGNTGRSGRSMDNSNRAADAACPERVEE